MKRIIRLAGTFVLAGATAPAAPGQAILREWYADATTSYIGTAVESFADLDGDGFGDVAYSTGFLGTTGYEVRSGKTGALLWKQKVGVNSLHALPDFDGDGRSEVGTTASKSVEVRSGATGNLLYSILLGLFDFPLSMVGIGDVDGDGVADLAVGTPGGYRSASPNGEVKVFSGATGTRLYAVSGAGNLDQFGSIVTTLPDVNGDGIADFAAGAPTGTVPSLGQRVGYVRACSGADGATLWQFDGQMRFASLGRQLATTSDHNGDGLGDLCISSTSDVNGVGSGRLWIVDSVSGAVVTTTDGPDGFDVGTRLVDAGDVDGDGWRDLLARTSRDQTWLYSGKTLLTLHTFEDLRGTSNGWAMATGHDVDGDGRADVVLGDFTAQNSAPYFGIVSIHGGNDLFLDMTPIEVADGDSLYRSIRTGVPGNLALLAIVEDNGVPVFWILGGLRTFDATGTVEETVIVPPGLAGNVYAYQGWAINARGKLSSSDLIDVTFR